MSDASNRDSFSGKEAGKSTENDARKPSRKPGLSKVISGKSRTEYETWQAPDVQTIAQQKQEKAGIVTARQLEELQKQAYDEGFQLGKDEGYQAGFQQGLEEGRQKGAIKGQEEIAQAVKYFQQIIKFLAKPIGQVDQSVEEQLVKLSMATAKQIIRREIHADPGQIMAVIKEALSVLPANSKKIKVYLHPSDAQIARENLNLNSQQNSAENYSEQDDEFWSVIDEPNITRGGCEIKSAASQIDASIETRVAEIAARILGSERVGSERAAGNRVASEKRGDTPSRDSDSLETVSNPEPEDSSEPLEPSGSKLITSPEEVKNDD